MGKKINELESTNVINNDDIFVISQSPTFEDSKQITKGDVFANTESEIKNTLGTDEYDNTSTYNVGDYCIYENVLYRCITEISVAEEFNSNHWTETKLLNVLDTLNNQLNLRKNIITAYLSSDFTITQANTYLPLTLSEKLKNGNKLTINNGGVKVGTGISKVKISFCLIVDPTNTRRIHVRVVKNNDVENGSVAWCQKNVTNGITDVLSFPPILINVNENDVLNLYYYLSENDVIRGSSYTSTYLTVEVVE